MLNIMRECVLLRACSISFQSVRFKNVIHTRRPRKPSFTYSLFRETTKPQIPKLYYDKYFPVFFKCRKTLVPIQRQMVKEAEGENPYERIIANEVKDHLLASKMVLVLHRGAMNGEQFYGSVVQFKKEGMVLMRNSRQTVTMAVENTDFTSLLQLFHYNCHTLLLCCPESKLKVAYTLLKKMPYYSLLAGIMEGRFLRRHTLDIYSSVSNIDEARAQLVSILNTSASQLVQNMYHHQIMTVTHLNQYWEQQKSQKLESEEPKSDSRTERKE